MEHFLRVEEGDEKAFEKLALILAAEQYFSKYCYEVNWT